MEFALIITVIATGFFVVLALTLRYLRTLQREIQHARNAFDQACAQSAANGSDPRKAHGGSAFARSDDPESRKAEAAAERALAYNNLVATYVNAAHTFPATLVARRLAFPYEPIDPVWVDRVLGRRYASSQKPDASRVMNPYMLWAAGMGDIALEDEERVD